jgi:uncharacterized membrane protein HdeD (DUF308 family)
MLGAALVASGIMRLILALSMKQGTPWGWVAVSSVITPRAGLIILARWPISGLFVLRLFSASTAGASWIGIGLGLRKAA